MVSKLGLSILMTLMLAGCAIHQGGTVRDVAYDFSDRDAYDHPYATSPAYDATSLGYRAPVDAIVDQTAPALAKSSAEGEQGAIDAKPEVAVQPTKAGAPEANQVPAQTKPSKTPGTAGHPRSSGPDRQSTSPGSTRLGQGAPSSADSVVR